MMNLQSRYIFSFQRFLDFPSASVLFVGQIINSFSCETETHRNQLTSMSIPSFSLHTLSDRWNLVFLSHRSKLTYSVLLTTLTTAGFYPLHPVCPPVYRLIGTVGFAPPGSPTTSLGARRSALLQRPSLCP